MRNKKKFLDFFYVGFVQTWQEDTKTGLNLFQIGFLFSGNAQSLIFVRR